MKKILCAVTALWALSPLMVHASEVELTTGETLADVQILRKTDSEVKILHKALGEITIPADKVAKTVFGSPQEEESATAVILPEWETTFEIGATGSSGNVEAVSGYARLASVYEDDKGRWNLAAQYMHTKTEGDITENRAVGDALREWKFGDSRWGAFADARYEYNDYSAFRHNASSHAGVTYTFIRTDDKTLLGRVGAGANYQDNTIYGLAANEGTTPEGLIGLEYRWNIDARQTFEADTTFYPNFEEGGEYRNISHVSYVLDIDAARALRMGAEYTYNSLNSPARKGDVKWYVSLVFKL